MEKDYNIEELFHTFHKHAVEFSEINEIDSFNLPRALALMCYEIKYLKKIVEKTNV
jgi:hypothetical protein